MREFRNENKKSKLVFDMKVVRRLLKMNGEMKYCPYCGKELAENCECVKNIVVDCKPLRGGQNGESVMVFDNNAAFQKAFSQIMEENKAKKKHEAEENLAADVD